MTSAVCRSKDRPKLTDSCPIIRVGEGDPCEIRLCSACLRDPVVPAIGCSENYATPANNCSSKSIRKGHPHKRTESPACLVNPCVSSICCSKDRSIVTNGGSIVRISKGNVLE